MDNAAITAWVALGCVLHIESAYEAPVVPRFSGFHRGLPSTHALFGTETNTSEPPKWKGLISKVAWPCVCFRNLSSVFLSSALELVCLCPIIPIGGWNKFITQECTHTHTDTHCGLSPAVTPHSRQMGDICSLEIFLHYCHRGTSLNVCFPDPVLMRTCLLKWWSTWQKTFTQHHAPTDHMCDSVLSSRASRVMFARCTTFAA